MPQLGDFALGNQPDSEGSGSVLSVGSIANGNLVFIDQGGPTAVDPATGFLRDQLTEYDRDAIPQARYGGWTQSQVRAFLHQSGIGLLYGLMRNPNNVRFGWDIKRLNPDGSDGGVVIAAEDMADAAFFDLPLDGSAVWDFGDTWLSADRTGRLYLIKYDEEFSGFTLIAVHLRVRRFSAAGAILATWQFDIPVSLDGDGFSDFWGNALLLRESADVNYDGSAVYLASGRYLRRIPLVSGGIPTIIATLAGGTGPSYEDGFDVGLRCSPTDDTVYAPVVEQEFATIARVQTVVGQMESAPIALGAGASHSLVFNTPSGGGTTRNLGSPDNTLPWGETWRFPWTVNGAIFFGGGEGLSVTTELVGATADASPSGNPHTETLDVDLTSVASSIRIANGDLAVGVTVTNNSGSAMTLGKFIAATGLYNIGSLSWNNAGDWFFSRCTSVIKHYDSTGSLLDDLTVAERTGDPDEEFTTEVMNTVGVGIDEDGSNLWVLLSKEDYIGWEDDLGNLTSPGLVVPTEDADNGGQHSVYDEKTELYRVPTDGSGAVRVSADIFHGAVDESPLWVYRSGAVVGAAVRRSWGYVIG